MIEGRCLCGTVCWTFSSTPDPATACNCTACRRYGALWIYEYEDEGITITGTTKACERENGVLGFSLLQHMWMHRLLAFSGIRPKWPPPYRRQPAAGGA